MHIADGILPAHIGIAADIAAVGAVYAGSRKIDSDEIPKMGIFTAALFIISLIHFPLFGTSVHLGLFGFAGLLFGKRAFPVIFITLLFQSLAFQHGGLVSVGINALIMGSGALAGWLLWDFLPFSRRVKGFLCGFFGIFLPALLVSLLFLFIDYGKGLLFFMSVYLPAAVVEGALTSTAVVFFQKVEPELLKR
ncbi:MAG: cobalt transporter CbiM [Candidatus Aminicenantes bacterium]|nr:cobalt transporter CbiM [Candidatus Aminicenantes bacterium]